jgi:adenylate cyclase
MPHVRRLTAILAADVAGYSRLMGADEEGTHERLRAHLAQLVEPKIKEHRGHTVKNTGDGLLAEFPSVVDAVRCAAEVQRGMADRNAEIPEDKRITFRIGVNLGDVIVEEHDIFGDGVNVAARLEGLAEPGGICISRVVRDQIRDKLPYPFEDRGEQSVKNIVRSVQVFALRPEAVAELPIARTPAPAQRRSGPAAVASAAAAALAIAFIAWWFWPATRSNPPPTTAGGSAAESALSAASLLAPSDVPRFSIVVLPFANLSDDREQQYFADGITDDLTTDLSRVGHMFVVSRNTAFTYKDKPVNAKQIGRDLGVRYVLDSDTGDLLAVQNEITGRLSNALNLQLIGVEAARPTDHPDALDYILRARAALNKGDTRDNYAEAIALLEHALAIDPQSVEARSWLALALVNRALSRMSTSRTADLARAKDLIGQSLLVSPRSTLAHYVKAHILRTEGQCEEAIPEYEMVIASNHNWAGAFAFLGQCKLLTGSIDETIPLEEQAIRLSPRDPFIHNRYGFIGQVHLLQSRTDEAIVWFERARTANPGLEYAHAWLAAAFALKGNLARARSELAEARKLSGGTGYFSINRMRSGNWGVPSVRELFESTYFAGLRKAGVPEE